LTSFTRSRSSFTCDVEKLNGVCHLLVYVNYHHLLYDVPPNALTGPDFEMLPNVLWDRGLMLARDPGLLYFH